jgi:hypothetical protein
MFTVRHVSVWILQVVPYTLNPNSQMQSLQTTGPYKQQQLQASCHVSSGPPALQLSVLASAMKGLKRQKLSQGPRSSSVWRSTRPSKQLSHTQSAQAQLLLSQMHSRQLC